MKGSGICDSVFSSPTFSVLSDHIWKSTLEPWSSPAISASRTPRRQKSRFRWINKTKQNKWFLLYFHSFASGRKGDTARCHILNKSRFGWFQRICLCFRCFFRSHVAIHLV
jgi:hypothetical protein